MPVTPNFDWEQTSESVVIKAELKGYKLEAIDIFISDTFVKVNAHPTYLLALDVLHEIVVEKSTFRHAAPVLTLTLAKKDPTVVWETLCIDKKTPPAVVKQRRQEALERAEALYNTKLQTREQQKEIEKKRMFQEHWELEKQQRRDIESKVKDERERESKSLAEWQTTMVQQEAAGAAAAEEGGQKSGSSSSSTTSRSSIVTPADIGTAPPIRQAETVNVSIDFTPKAMAVPTRTRGDEDYYRKSRYKPVSVEDAPMFWKEKADKFYRSRMWKQAADAYSESIKRDGCFLSCVSNRAACWMRLHQYSRAVEDCDLALRILANTPASETTQERYRFLLTKLHTRRGAAYAWNGDYTNALDDLRMASAYRNTVEDHDVEQDLQTLESYMKAQGLVECRDPSITALQDANRLYYAGNYAGAVEAYRAVLAGNEFDAKARANLCAALLQMGSFQEAYEESLKLQQFCADVAQALSQPGVSTSTLADSDDEEECDDEMVAKRNEAAKKISEKSGHVYLLLKAYVRGAAALCGMKQYRKAFELMEAAVRITPYDDDLRDDAQRLAEKIRFETLVSASTSGGGGGGSSLQAATATREQAVATS